LLHRVAMYVYCRLLSCVALCCIEMQCVAGRCRVLQGEGSCFPGDG